MARFYGSLQGNRGQTTRMGTPSSGIKGHLRGWSIGAKVQLWVGPDGSDRVTVQLTGGSHNPSTLTDLGTYREGPEGDPVRE